MKHCSTCYEWKDESQYYNRVNQCKSCLKAKQEERLSDPKHRADLNTYQRKCNRTPEGKKRRAKIYKKYYESKKGRTKRQEYLDSPASKKLRAIQTKTARERYPEKHQARHKVGHAVEKGKMPPAIELTCTFCGAPAVQYHHHKGYTKKHQLDIIALCLKCHTTAG